MCRIFPGQVVAVRGMNPTGSCILALELQSQLPSPAAPACPGDARDEDGPSNLGEPLPSLVTHGADASSYHGLMCRLQ